MLDWAILQDPRRRTAAPMPAPALPPKADPIVERARFRPIVFREICPPAAAANTLSFYGGAPVGPATLVWPRVRNKPDEAPLSFLMQWDCQELASQDGTGLLPKHGALYLFLDLTWGDPFGFQFLHAPGPTEGWQALPIPPGLPPIFGSNGAYQVPYCSPRIAQENQDVPRLLPKWPFTPVAFSYPAPAPDGEACFWSEAEAVGEALLRLQHPEGVPPAGYLNQRQRPFGRPFDAFPHDYAAIRVVAAKVLEQMRMPKSRLLRETSQEEREARFERWRDQASQHYISATAQRPGAKVEQALSDEIWHWMEELEPVLALGWGSLIEECVNVSLGLGSEAAGALPPEMVAVCAERHRLTSAYLHEEYADRRTPEALAAWEKRKAEGTLREVRTVHAPCPNHMFGPPSFVQGYVEEHLEHSVLLLELSSQRLIGFELGEGVLQFMIQPGDLRAGRFDKTVLIASAY